MWFQKTYPPHGRSLEIPRGRGSQQPKFVRKSMELNLEIPGKREGSNEKTFHGGVWILSGTTQ